MTTINDQNIHFEGSVDIEAKLLALESGENLPDRETYRAAVRNYQNYFVAYLVGRDGTRRVFTLPNLYGIESIPVFLAEEDFLSFQNDYLRKHALLDDIENRQESLELKMMSGRELFEIIPNSRLSSFFVLPAEDEELFLSFNLAKVFLDCFREIQTEIDWDTLADEFEISATADERNVDPVTAKAQKAQKEIEIGRKFRQLFEIKEWIVLTSQPTANKLLKGEVSRDDFDLDRFGNKRVVIFSDAQALQDFKIATGQEQIKFYNVKVDAKRIFGSDISKYEIIIANPRPPSAAKIKKENFTRLNELYTASEIEKKLVRIKELKIGFGPDCIDLKEFQRFILPLDKRQNEANFPLLDSPVYLIQDDSGNKFFPIFTARDSFESFRLKFDKAAYIEPYFIDGERLFGMWHAIKPLNIVFNAGGSVQPITFSPDFALRVYCA